jgi:hypothetical protein
VGGLSRDELAGFVAGAILSKMRGITVEAYRKSTRTKLQPDYVVPSGNELAASTYSMGFLTKHKVTEKRSIESSSDCNHLMVMQRTSHTKAIHKKSLSK